MNRRNFIFALLAAIGLRKLLPAPAASQPFGVFQIDEPYWSNWNSNTATAELARLNSVRRYDLGWPQYELTQEILDDDAFHFPAGRLKLDAL